MSTNHYYKSLAAGLGFEPRLTASKAAVLPLDDLAKIWAAVSKWFT